MIHRICFITSSYTTWHATFLLVSIIEIMMNEVIIHFDKENHVLDVRKIGGKVSIHVGYKCLFERVKGNNSAGSVVESIRRLA
jgi:hypothetical protein